jgi:hypothetical protein
MKKIICSVLVISLLNLSGCYTYSALNEEEIENNHPTKDDAFVIVLKDGSEIEYDIEDNPQAFFVRVTKNQKKFWDKVNRKMIDSTKSIETEYGIYDIFWLKDSTRVTFKTGEYFNILPEDSTGYWILGKSGNDIFSGKIDFSDIAEIQEKNVNQVVNVVLIVIVVGVFVYLVAALVAVGKTAKALGDL